MCTKLLLYSICTYVGVVIVFVVAIVIVTNFVVVDVVV